MKHKTVQSIAVALLLGAAASTTSAQAPSYSVRFVGEGTPSGINDLGQVSGNLSGRAWIADPGSAPALLPLPAGASASESRAHETGSMPVGVVPHCE